MRDKILPPVRPARRRFALLAAALLLGGCTAGWRQSELRESSGKGDYAVQVPEDWMVIRKGTQTTISRHGPAMEQIGVDRHSLKKYKYHASSLRVFPGIKPYEMAEIQLYELQSSAHFNRARAVLLEPARAGGMEGFSMTVQYLSQGLEYTAIICQFAREDDMYELWYVALSQHYFQASLPVFKALLESFKTH